MKKVFSLLVVSQLFMGSAFAQNAGSGTITGSVIDSSDESVMVGVNVFAVSVADSTRGFGEVTGSDGRFAISVRPAGAYDVTFSFIGFESVERRIDVPRGRVDIGQVKMKFDVLLMDEVRIEAVQERVEVRGDTTIFNAAAFKVNPDATAEDLLAKLPGVVVDGGEVQVQGETVRRVLVDGREFFGQDPAAALRNLPSEIIDRIEVYDRQSDQAQFTGFEDDNTEKTINIITLTGKSNGQFGKLYGGYGSEEHYISGGNINIFDDDRRISIIGLSNNVNQQNFSIDDLLGVVGSAGGRSGFGGRGGGRRGGRGAGGGGRPGGGGGRGGGGDRARLGGFSGRGGGGGGNPSNFLVGSQGGINTTHAIGLNYSDQIGSKLSVTGSYFFNKSDNTSASLLDREYYLGEGASQFYDENTSSTADNNNHRLSGRITYTIDDKNSLIFTPRLSTQSNQASSFLFGTNVLDTAEQISQTTNDYISDNRGYNGSASLLVRHRFDKQGRTLSLNLTASANNQTGDTSQISNNLFFDGGVGDQLIDQKTDSDRGGSALSARLAFTEPIGAFGQLQINYSPRRSISDSERLANTVDPVTNTYSILDPVLSNQFDNTVWTQRGGISYTRRKRGTRIRIGSDVQTVNLTGDQTFPVAFGVDKTFTNLLPRIELQIGSSRQKSLRLQYRTSTSTPSISQLQDVIDNSNPLILSSGNPDLRQSFTNSFSARFNSTNLQNGRIFFGFASFTTSRDYIGDESLIAVTDLVLDGGVPLQQGSQFSRPVNLDGYRNLRTFFTFGRPASFIKSNVNLNGGVTWTRTPGIINSIENVSEVTGFNGGLVLSSNISPRLDFTLSQNFSYNISENSIYPELDTNYTQYRASGKVTAMPTKSLVLETSLNYSSYGGLGDSFDSRSILLNAALGYKFLAGNGGEVRLIVADILNQNTNVSRSVTEFYVEDQSSNVLGRYLLLNFTYTLRNFRI